MTDKDLSERILAAAYANVMTIAGAPARSIPSIEQESE